jgi:hypothetical protein
LARVEQGWSSGEVVRMCPSLIAELGSRRYSVGYPVCELAHPPLPAPLALAAGHRGREGSRSPGFSSTRWPSRVHNSQSSRRASCSRSARLGLNRDRIPCHCQGIRSRVPAVRSSAGGCARAKRAGFARLAWSPYMSQPWSLIVRQLVASLRPAAASVAQRNLYSTLSDEVLEVASRADPGDTDGIGAFLGGKLPGLL